jgi:hypothetical protein
MSLKDKLLDDMKSAMKNQEKLRLSVIRMVRAAIKNTEIDKKKEIADNEIIDVIARELKQRRDAIPEFAKGGRMDKVAELEEEISILKEYLPKELSEEEIREVVRQTIIEVNAVEKKDLGKVMKAVMPHLKGRADGKIVNQIVNELLNN